MHNIGTFYDVVKENIQNGKKYNYFIKRDANFKHSMISFFKSHDRFDNIDFIIIPSEKYYFYDEVYLYEYERDAMAKAYEFLPSISNEKEQMLYYIELDINQTKRLLDIKKHLQKKYGEKSKYDVEKINEKIDEFTNI